MCTNVGIQYGLAFESNEDAPHEVGNSKLSGPENFEIA